MAQPAKRNAVAELQSLSPAKQTRAANDHAALVKDSSSRVMPSPTMRKNLNDVCEYYGLIGWTKDETDELKAEYQAELQRVPFDTVADVLDKSGALARTAIRKFHEGVAAVCAARRAA